VLGEGEGGAGDRFLDAQAGRQTLHQRGFASAKRALQQQQRSSR
jgi:hypothetical protein